MSRDRPREVNQGLDAVRPWHSSNNKVSVTLECGHLTTLRSFPMSERSRYPCRNNSGCGYQLRWRKWIDMNGIERLNRLLQREEAERDAEE